MTEHGDTVDVAVVGAGPAGMAAALAAAGAGCTVALVDAGARPGGQYHRQPPEQFALPVPDPPRALFDRLAGHPHITVHSGRTVYATEPGGRFTLHLTPGDPVGRISARAVVLATGGYDRVLPFPGWDLPGVFTAGGAQALVKGQRVLPGDRMVVGGTGPFLLPVAAALAGAGTRVRLVAEAGTPFRFARYPAAFDAAKLREAAGYARTLARHRVPLRHRHAVIRAEGTDHVERVTVARLDRQWRVRATREYEVDAVCVGYGFVPSVELAAALGCTLRTDPHGAAVVATRGAVATSVPGVYAAGEVTGVGGAAMAATEGELAGLAAAKGLGRPVDAPRDLLRAHARQVRFAAALDDVYRVRPGWTRWLAADTVICRCEEVPLRAVTDALDLGRDVRSVKLRSRAGMGYCQARMCGPALAALVDQPGTEYRVAGRPLSVPVRLDELGAGE